MGNPTVRKGVAAVAAVVGGYLLYLSANPESGPGTTFWSFLAGLALFVGVAALLLRFYAPGREDLSPDEVGVREWKVARFLRFGRDAAPLYLGLRLFLAYEWISSGWGKVTNEQWTGTGEALRAYWQRAVAVPQPPARPAITYPAYRSLIQYMLDHNWHGWFADLVAWGEVLIGVGFLVGGLVGIAAFFALLMNFSFIFAGSTSSNPTLIILQVILILGWRVAGWWGADRLLLPYVGTPWAPGRLLRAAEARADR